MQPVQLTRTHRLLVGVVVAGAVVIAGIGFAGSYTAVRDLAEHKGFGAFAPFFPIGVDAGIVVLLALDLLLTWVRIPFPLLRQTAWLLTAATIAFNGAAAWPDPLGVGMHAVIPVLFVVAVEAARHAVGRIADITADKHMEGVRLSRWLLAFPSTFRLWRRMKLWELRSYDEVIRMEQDRLVYEARLRAQYGRGWRRRAPVESLMPLKLSRYGIPLAETAPSALAATGTVARLEPAGGALGSEPSGPRTSAAGAPAERPQGPAAPEEREFAAEDAGAMTEAFEGQRQEAAREHIPEPDDQTPATASPAASAAVSASTSQPEPEPEPASHVTVPVGPGRRRALGNTGSPAVPAAASVPAQRTTPAEPAPAAAPAAHTVPTADSTATADTSHVYREETTPVGIPDGVAREEFYFLVYRQFVAAQGGFPTARQLSRTLYDGHGVADADGSLLGEAYLRPYLREFKERYNTEMGLAG